MKWISRLILLSIITLLVLTTACTLPAQPPAATLPVAQQVTNTPLTLSTVIINETPAPAIPITGMDVLSLQCQFCVNTEAHAVLIMSNQAFFNVADPGSGVTCLSAQEVNGRRILLCRGAQKTSFTLNVCVDKANCLEFPITLQPCPLIPATGSGTPTAPATFIPLTPIILAPRNTLIPPTRGPSTNVPPTTAGSTTASPTTIPSTPVPTDTAIDTPIPPTSVTEPPPEPTSTTEPATAEPPPEPTATNGGTGGGGGDDDEQLVICHVSQGNSNDRTTITVSRSSWENVHSQHGDSMGAC